MCRRTLQMLLLLTALLAFPAMALAVAPDIVRPLRLRPPRPRSPPFSRPSWPRASNKAAAASAQSAGDNAWMLTSAALVLLMTGPGLALFYGGLVRKKNILGTMMQSFAMMGLVTVLWAICRLLAGLRPRQLRSLAASSISSSRASAVAQPDYAPTIPEQTLMIYQLMFAIITPALIYRRLCRAHEVQRHGHLPLALVAVRLLPHGAHGLGRGRPAERQRRPLSLRWISPAARSSTSPAASRRWLPASIWASASATRRPRCSPTRWCSASSARACCGWAGSASMRAARWRASSLATSAFINTHFAAAAAAIGWSIVEWIHNGKPTALGAISGAVAGLVAITPASGFVQPMSALAIGLAAGFFCSFMVFMVKSSLRLRRFARRLWRPWRRRNPGRYPHRLLRRQRHQSASARTRPET